MNEAARVRELALMAELYEREGEKQKAEQVMDWCPALKRAKAQLKSTEEVERDFESMYEPPKDRRGS